MALQDGLPVIVCPVIKTDTANTDFAVVIPNAGSGYVVRRVTAYDASGDNSSALLGVYTAAAGGGTTIVTAAALTTHTAATVVSDRTVIAPATTAKLTAASLFVRVTTASGVAGTTIKVAIEYSPLP